MTWSINLETLGGGEKRLRSGKCGHRLSWLGWSKREREGSRATETSIHINGEAASLTSFITPMNIWSTIMNLIHHANEFCINYHRPHS